MNDNFPGLLPLELPCIDEVIDLRLCQAADEPLPLGVEEKQVSIRLRVGMIRVYDFPGDFPALDIIKVF